jgi:hypothetical protein
MTQRHTHQELGIVFLEYVGDRGSCGLRVCGAATETHTFVIYFQNQRIARVACSVKGSPPTVDLNHLVNGFEIYEFDTFLHQCDAPSM